LSETTVRVAPSDIGLEPLPINPDWIIEGSPEARWRLLFKTDDGIAQTVIWDCTAGVFHWNYYSDETIHVIEGGVTITTQAGTKDVRTGDVMFIPAGSETIWHVDNYIRKVAFLRQPLPHPTGLALRAYNRVRYRKYRSQF